jgi:hypothetical protein
MVVRRLRNAILIKYSIALPGTQQRTSDRFRDASATLTLSPSPASSAAGWTLAVLARRTALLRGAPTGSDFLSPLPWRSSPTGSAAPRRSAPRPAPNNAQPAGPRAEPRWRGLVRGPARGCPHARRAAQGHADVRAPRRARGRRGPWQNVSAIQPSGAGLLGASPRRGSPWPWDGVRPPPREKGGGRSFSYRQRFASSPPRQPQ